MKSCHLLKNKTKNILFISFLVTLIVSLLCSTTGIAKADSGTTLKALEDDANGYKPTQIVNGDFSEMPWMDFVYDGTTYTKETAGPSTVLPTTNYTVSTIYNEKGWNTSETSAWKDSVFEYIVGSVAEDDYYSYDMASARKKDNIQYAYNKGLLTEFQNGTNKGCVELNASSSAIFYQDLTTYSNDVIRWSLKHATRNENGKGDTPATQTMYVEIGATPFNASGNVIPASGINSSKDTKIVSGLATYTSTGVSGTNGYANTSDLQYLALTRPTNYDDTDQKQGDKWYDVTGVYVVPSGQTTTRFAFVSNDTGSKGNLMDDVEFSTLIGNVHAQLVSNGDLVITGYWGETDTSKHLNIKFGSTVKQIDMSSVCGQNFILTLSGSTYGSLYNGISTVDIYHEDYSSAKTTIKINHVHDWNYDVSGNKLSISCKNTTGACDFKDLGVSSVSVSINAENKEYDGTAYSLASISGDIDNWLRTGQYLPSIYYEGKGDTSYTLSKTAPTNAGTYYAKISSDEKSYASTTFTITQKEVELEWGTNSFTYNGSEQKPTATVKSTSLCGSDSCSVTVTGGQTNVGSSYTATASSLSNGNYKLPSSKTKTFSISQKAITITASAQTIGFSESISSGTSNVVVDTLCTGDSLNSITLTPSGSSVTTSGTITPSGAVIKNGTTDVTSNYSITYNTGNLTITVKSITDGDSNLVITLSASSSVYTGSEIKPTITGITYNSTALTTSDYQISSYENNKNVGTSAKVNITLKGNYSGSVSTTFSITQKEVELEWSNLTFTYDGSAHKPTASVKATSLCGTDTCSVTVSGEQTNVGSSYTATASGLGNSNYKLPSSNTNTFSITAKSITDGDDKLVITLSADSSTYTGSEITPTISGITYNSVALTTSDYEISSYENNVNVGTSAKVNLTLKGNYTGCVSTTFSITQKAITITASAQTISYGECITSTTSDVVVDTLGTGDSLSSITLTPSGSALTTSGTITPSGAVIKKGTTDVTSNYSITYDTGVLTINEKEIEDGDDNLVITLSADSATYTGSEITPTITGITYNSVALTTSDYEIASYENNVNVGTSAKVNVTLKGNYTGSVSTTFSITVKAITITASAQTITFGTSITSTTSDVVVATLGTGDLLSSITLTPSGSEVTTSGTITPSGAVIKKGTTDVTSNYDITYDTGVLTINAKEIEDGDDKLVITLSADSSTYTGSEITPTITGIIYNSVALTTSDYEISSYENNIYVGTSAKVNVTLKGNYTGCVSTTFSITQKEITITASAQTITFGTSITSTTSDVVVETLGTGDSLSSITLTPSGSEVTTSGTITPSGAVIKKGTIDVTSNYDITYTPGNLTINSKSIDDGDDNLVITLSADSSVYTGSEITPTITGITYNSVVLTTSDYEIFGYENNINVGTSAKVNITLKGTYSGSVSTTFSITPKEVELEWGSLTFTYNGLAQKPTASVKSTSLCGTDTCSVTVTGEQTNVGNSYAAIATALGNDNYKLPLVTTAVFSITAKEITITASAQTITFGTSITTTTSDVVVDTLCDGDLLSSITLTPSGSGVTTSGTITPSGAVIKKGTTDVTANYDITYDTGVLTINAKEIEDGDDNLVITLSADSSVYTGSEITPTITGITYNSVALTTSDYEIASYENNVNVGTSAKVNVTLKGNYTGCVSATFSITPKEVELEWGSLTFTYNGSSQKPTASVKSTSLCGTDTCSVTVTGEQTNVGSGYTATASSLGNDNYKLPSSNTNTFSITQKEIELEWGSLTFTYNGLTQKPTASVKSTSLCGADTCSVTVTGEQTNVGNGYTATASGLGNDNYKLPSSNTNTFSITQKEVELTWDTTTIVYNGLAQKPTASVKSTSLCGTDTCSVTVTGEQTNVGSGYTATASSLLNNNYKLPSNNTTTFSITPKEVELEWDSLTFTYNGLAQKPTASVKSTSLCGTDTCSVTVTGEQTNVGSGYAVMATALGNDNYKLPSVTTAIFSITAKEITITASAQTISYGECITSTTSDVVVDTLCDGDLLSSITLTPSGSALTTNGTITPSGAIIKKGTVDVTSNYAITYDTGVLTINEKEIEDGDDNLVITLSADSSVYTGSEITPTITGITYNSVALTTSDYEISSYENNVNVGTSAKVNVTLKGNYTGSVSTTFSITQKEITITASAQTITFGTSITSTASDVVVETFGTGDSVDSITLTPSGSDVTTNGTITPSGAVIKKGDVDVTSNYSITYDTGVLTINAKEIEDDDDDLVITLSADSATYTGSEITPTITGITYNSVALTTSDYEISGYENNIYVGTSAKVNVTLKGNYTGSVSTTFSITQKAITITANAQTIDYGSSISSLASDVVVETLGTGDSLNSITLTPSGSSATTSGTITPSGAVIKKGTTDVTSNYSITYDTGLLVINGKRLDDVLLELEEKPDPLNDDDIIEELIVKDGDNKLEKDKDYEEKIVRNEETGENEIVITPKGDYTGDDIIKPLFEYDMSSITYTDVKVAYDELGHNIAIQGTLPKKVQVHYGDDKIEAGIYTMTASFTTTSIYHKAPSSMTAKLTIKSTVLDNGNKGDEKPTVLVSFPDGFDPSIHISADLKLRQELNKSVKDLEKNYGPFYLTYGAYSVTLYRYVTIDDVVTVEEVQPGDIAEGTILTLRMVFPTELKGKNFKLLHIHSDDDINEIVQSDELKVGTYIIDEEGYIVTMIDRLSEFALIYEGVCFAHWFMLGATILDILFILVTLIFIKKNAKISGLVCASWFAVINIIACIFAHCTFCWILIGFNSALLIGTIIFALLYKGENDNDDGSKSKDDEEKKSGENTGSTAKDKIANAGKIFIGKCKQIASTVKDKSVNAGKFLIGKCKQATNTVKDKFTKTSDDKNEVAKNQTTNDSSDSNETENKNSGETVKLANYEEAGKNDNDSEAEKEKLSLKESVAKAQETKAEISLNKEGIAKWLKEEYGENVTLNTRGNQTKTGLPLADTHYMEIDGKQKCFIYVYDVDGKSFAIVRGNEKVAKEISAKGHKIMPSAFPKTRDGGKWYTLLIDDSYKSSEEFCDSLRAVVSNLNGKMVPANGKNTNGSDSEAEKEKLSLKESVAKAQETKAEISLNKEGIAKWLKEEYGENVTLNTRGNQTKTGLPLADTHYMEIDGKQKCFIYVYDVDGKSFAIVRGNEKVAKEISAKGHKIIPSAFPKTRDGGKWYTLLIDDSYKSSEEFCNSLRAVVSNLSGNKLTSATDTKEEVPVINVEEEEEKELEDLCKSLSVKEEIPISYEGENGVEVVGVCFLKKKKVYKFSPNGKVFNEGQKVVVDTVNGQMVGMIVFGNYFVDPNSLVAELKNVIDVIE